MWKFPGEIRRILHVVRSFKTRSFFIKLLLVVLAFVVLFSAVNAVIMLYVNRMMLNKEIKTQSVYMDYSIAQINSSIERVSSVIDALLVDSDFVSNLQNYSRNPRNYTESSTINQTMDKMKIAKTSEEYISDMFVYMQGNNYVATQDGVTDSVLYFEKTLRSNASRWRELCESPHRLDIEAGELTSSATPRTIYVLNSLFINAKKIGCIVVGINVDKLTEQLSGTEFSQGRSIFLMTKNGNLLCRFAGTVGRDEITLAVPLLNEKVAEKNNYLIQIEKSSSSGIYLVILTPMGQIYDNVSAMLSISTAVLASAFTAGIVLAFYLSKKIYMPMLRLLDFIQSSQLSGGDYRKGEIGFIENNVATILKGYEKLEHTVASSTPLILEALFKKVITGVKSDDSLDKMTSDLSIDFRDGYYQTVVLRLEMTFSPYDQKELDYILGSSLMEQIKQFIGNSVVSVFRMKRNETILVLFNGDTLASPGIEENFTRLVESILVESGRCNCIVGIGESFDSPYSMDKSYQGAVQAIEHRSVGESRMVLFSSIPLRYENEPIIAGDLEKRLFNYVTSGNIKMAGELIEETLKVNYARRVSTSAYRRIVFTLYNCLLRIYEGVSPDLEKDAPFCDVPEKDMLTVEKYAAIALENCNILSSYYSRLNQKDLIQDILSYIDRHLEDDIGLENIAGALGLTPNYLTRYFNKQMETNFRQYINSKRIEKAKKMLIDTRKTVKEISSLCGYNSSNQFIATFVKFEGFTPVEFRRRQYETSDFKNSI